MADTIYKDKGVKIVERLLSIHEIISAHREGRLIECFGVATSNFVQPIKLIAYKDVAIDLTTGPQLFTNYIRDMLYKLHVTSNKHPWIQSLID